MGINPDLKVRLDIAYDDCEDESDAYMFQRLQDEVETFDETINDDASYCIVWEYLEGD